jgi:hypothetical protein
MAYLDPEACLRVAPTGSVETYPGSYNSRILIDNRSIQEALTVGNTVMAGKSAMLIPDRGPVFFPTAQHEERCCSQVNVEDNSALATLNRRTASP